MQDGMEKIQNLINDFAPPGSTLVIHAGHFLLLYDKAHDSIIPGIYSNLKEAGYDAELCKEIGYFPLITWEAALRSLTASEASVKRILLVVNDWQYLKHLKRRRYEFYNAYSILPEEFRSAMDTCGINNGILLAPHSKANTGLYFSEIYLRNKFQRFVRKNGVEIRMNDCLVEKTGVYCGRPNCIAEITQLIKEVSTACGSNACFVNFYPLSCREYVEEGTRLAKLVYEIDSMRILNLGIPNIGIENINELAEKMVISKNY